MKWKLLITTNKKCEQSSTINNVKIRVSRPLTEWWKPICKLTDRHLDQWQLNFFPNPYEILLKFFWVFWKFQVPLFHNQTSNSIVFTTPNNQFVGNFNSYINFKCALKAIKTVTRFWENRHIVEFESKHLSITWTPNCTGKLEYLNTGRGFVIFFSGFIDWAQLQIIIDKKLL